MPSYLYLTPVLGGPEAPRYPLTAGPLLVGRSEHVDIPLLDPTVSRRHASITVEEGAVQLTDLGSKHGTFVNSRRISSTTLRVGDIVVFGLTVVLRLEVSAQPVLSPGGPRPTIGEPRALEPTEVLVRGAVAPVRRLSTGPEVRLPSLREPGAETALCISLLPEALVRLRELRNDLQRMVDDGARGMDPSPMLTSVESVLATVSRIAEVMRDEAAPL